MKGFTVVGGNVIGNALSDVVEEPNQKSVFRFADGFEGLNWQLRTGGGEENLPNSSCVLWRTAN